MPLLLAQLFQGLAEDRCARRTVEARRAENLRQHRKFPGRRSVRTGFRRPRRFDELSRTVFPMLGRREAELEGYVVETGTWFGHDDQPAGRCRRLGRIDLHRERHRNSIRNQSYTFGKRCLVGESPKNLTSQSSNRLLDWQHADRIAGFVGKKSGQEILSAFSEGARVAQAASDAQ